MIKLNQHKATITKRIIAQFSDYVSPKKGLSAFFPTITTAEKQISIEVQRHKKRIAVDVQRGTQGNLNSWENSTEKLYVPPFYKESFDLASLDVYNVTFGETTPPTRSQATRMIGEANEKLNMLRDMIEGSKENQRAQALQTGIVTMKNGDNIDFKRKAESLEVLTGTNLWTDAASNPLTDFERGIKFIRQEGKSSSRTFNAVFGQSAYTHFRANAKVKEFGDFRNITILELNKPQFDDVTGMTFQGRLALKNGTVDLWTYDEFYEDENDSKVEYIEENNVILLPGDFKASTSHAGVPAILKDTENAEFPEFIGKLAAEYHVNNYIDPRAMSHFFDLFSAPLAVPFSIDRIWTVKVAEDE